MDYLLNDLVDYTMEKIAAEEMSEEDRYNQELAKAKKRKLIGLGLMGGGFAAATGVGVHGQKEFAELSARRDKEALERQQNRVNWIFNPDFYAQTDHAIDQINRQNDLASVNQKIQRRAIIPRAAFIAGAGTLSYNNLKKKQARRRYEDYLNSQEKE